MFRFQDNLPEVYINESRDFQLLARLSDALFSGIKYDVDSMVNILDATLTKDRMLQLMCTKIGFFPKIDIDAQVLKYIIASFPYIIKNKGNILGIKAAVNAILKAESNPDAIGEPKIIIVNKEATLDRDPFTVYIYTRIKLYNQPALEEVLRYVLPSGYNYKILQYSTALSGYENPDIFSQADTINILRVDPTHAAELRTPVTLGEISDETTKHMATKYINAYDTTEIVTPLSLSKDDSNKVKLVVKDNSNVSDL